MSTMTHVSVYRKGQRIKMYKYAACTQRLSAHRGTYKLKTSAYSLGFCLHESMLRRLCEHRVLVIKL